MVNEMKPTLLIPIAPLFRTKSRLRDCFSKEQLKQLTISMFIDLAIRLKDVNCFKDKIVYCNGTEVLETAEDYGLIGIKEEITDPRKSFATVISDLNSIAIDRFGANKTVFTFLDLILISKKNFHDVAELLTKNKVVVCPALHSGGISILGRNPPEIISSSCFSDSSTTSFISLFNEIKRKNMDTRDLAIYDSFRASFDVDVKKDLILAHEYLKIFNLTDTETFHFLEKNLKVSIKNVSKENNRSIQYQQKN